MLLLKSSLEAVKAWMMFQQLRRKGVPKNNVLVMGLMCVLEVGAGSLQRFLGQAGDSDHQCRGISCVWRGEGIVGR